MIETMKSVTLVSLARNKDEMLHSLRKAGILHIRELVPSCAQSAAISQEIHQLMSLSNAVSDEAGKDARDAVQEKLDGPAFKSLVQSLEKALQDRKAASEERLRLSGELSRVEAWGEFDPQAVAELAECGFALDFYTVDERVLDSLRGDESVCFITLGEISRMKAIATVNSKLPDGTAARKFILPQLSLSAMRKRLKELSDTIEASSALLASACKYLDQIRLKIRALEEESMYQRVKATSRDEEDVITVLSGYLPQDAEADFTALAKSSGWAYLIDDVSEEENPPTKLKYKGLIRIIQPVYDILGTVPGYREYDISSWFLLFFSIFFAMIIGDAGYGLIFLIIAVVMNVRAGKCSDINILLYVLSATTIIYGAVTGTWFGSLAVLEKLPFLQLFIIPSICNYSMELYGIESVYAQNNVMQLCFILGAAQLGLACVLNVIHKAKNRDLSLLGDIGWLIDVVVLYMMALYLVIGAEVNFSLVIAGVAAGFALVVIFGSQEPGKSFASGLRAGLGGFFTSFLDTVSCFSNIMSYIRLFAVGMASLAIAQSFNNMAGMAGPVFGFLIVVLGTALNLVMGLLSVVVHGVRLNLLEFSGQLSMEWTGYKYEPFRETVNTDKNSKQGVVK